MTVVDTELGRIGMAICFDGDFPELWRIQAVQGAEVIVRPSALLRSADIAELTSRARAYDNHVYVVAANATGTDPAGRALLRQQPHRRPDLAHVARAASHEGWVIRPARPGDRDGLADPGKLGAAVVRPPRRAQPRRHQAVRRRPGAHRRRRRSRTAPRTRRPRTRRTGRERGPGPDRHRHRRHLHRRRRGRRGLRRDRHHQDAVHAGRPRRGLPGRDRQGPGR